MRDKLQVRLVEFAGGYLVMQILQQPEEWRRGDVFTASNGMFVRRLTCPDLTHDCVWLRGASVKKDMEVMRTNVDRDKVVQALSEFVAHMDGVKSEVGETCQKCKNWTDFGEETECRLCPQDAGYGLNAMIASVCDILNNGWPPVPDWCPNKATKIAHPVITGDVYTW